MLFIKEDFDEYTLSALRELYEDAFPEDEKKPFSVILDRREMGTVELLALIDEAGEFSGLAITAKHRELVLLDYFAIAPKKRGKGIGTEALKMLQKRYTGRRFVLEIEDDAVPADNTRDRIRRKHFYLSCGMEIMPYRISLFGIEMLILTYGGPVKFDEYHGIYRAVYSEELAENVRLLG